MRLAELLRQHYIHGGGDAMKLMLNGKNPGEAARNIEYLRLHRPRSSGVDPSAPCLADPAADFATGNPTPEQ
jgi:hypothetical protein